MVRIIKDIKAYTLADMALTTPKHVNSRSVTLYDRNGLEMALQGTSDEKCIRVHGSSPEQYHPHDELVYILSGENECFTREGVEHLASNFVRIPPGVKHGGESYGIWISVKPKLFVFDHGDEDIGDRKSVV